MNFFAGIICNKIFGNTLLVLTIMIMISQPASGKDIYVSGKVTTVSGSPVPNAKVTMTAGNIMYGAVSRSDGSYSLRVSGIYSEITDLLEGGTPYPNPFTYSVNIPFIINSPGDIRFSVYSLAGQKISEINFNSVTEGSYRIIWDGCSNSGTPVRQGLYIYAITFKGETWSGKIIKAPGYSSYSSSTTLEPVMLPPVTPPATTGPPVIPVITAITCTGYYPLRQTDITLRSDTIIDFRIARTNALPYKTDGGHIAMLQEQGYRSLFLKGINLGASTPGTFPGEIAYAIPDDLYETWISRMAEAGFNSIRIYTLHPPVFYEKLANYNNSHPENPLLLFQGIWLDEVENPGDPSEYDLFNRSESFKQNIEEVINCIHGKMNISFRPGRAYGNYSTDISRWTAGYIIGREISSQEVESTNKLHPDATSFAGSNFSISGASAAEVFVTQSLDQTVTYENNNYSVRRPVSISSWPTLDPLTHPTEIYTDEDKSSFNIVKISGRDKNAGIFATYHAYPYYPNFVSQQPSYQSYSDSEGKNSYLGYLNDLKNHYSSVALVIGEVGVPSSWGSAHQSYSSMDHGGYSEKQQGEKNMRLMHNISDAGCAGGFMFAWMDEWFKPTWIVGYLEAFGFLSGNAVIPTRQLWLNLTSPEQNFGLIAFDQKSVLPFIAYQTNNTSGSIKKLEATNDNAYFYLNIETKQNISNGDTILVAFDTYSAATGESRLLNGRTVSNRAEFLLMLVPGEDTALYHVTEAYDMKGLTPRFNLSDPSKQKYRSTVSDGAPWKVMEWINDEYSMTSQYPGRMPMENSTSFSPGSRCGAAWSASLVKIRIPWTLLYFYDPTRMQVVNGAISNDGGYSFEIQTTKSEGIAVSVYNKGTVVSTTDRYTWKEWLIVPETICREKESLRIVETGLKAMPGFIN